MYRRYGKLHVGLVIILELVVLSTAIYSVASSQWKDFFLSLLAMISFFVPFIIMQFTNKRRITLPSSFISISLIFIFLAQYLGEINEFYLKFWWWDLILHIIFGVYAVIIALKLIQGIAVSDQASTIQRFGIFTSIYAFSFSIALGTIWEMFEFIGDNIFNTNMVKGGLEDTSIDMIVKIIAAFITSFIYYKRFKRQMSFNC